jgi:cytochrome P450
VDEQIQSPRAKCPFAFDHESVGHAQHWPEEYRQLREESPLAWTEEHGGYWVATKYQDIVRMAQDGATFSSHKSFDPATQHVEGGITIPPTPIPRGLPVEADRPEWDGFRGLINRKFGPRAAEARRNDVRTYVTALLDRVIEKGSMDLVYDLTGPAPAITTMALIGFPLREWREVADPLHEMVATPKSDPEFPKVIERVNWIYRRVAEEAAERRRMSREQLLQRDDLLSLFVTEQVDGRYLTDEEILSYCNNILPGGVDTTTALTTHTLVYLHDHPEEKQRLIEHPELLPLAREEFVRYVTPLHALARTATQDVNVDGQHIEKGDRVLLAWSAANRDPEVFENPDQVVMDRYPNRHIGFGAGTHRCIGSFLARVMFEEMVTQVLARIPDYKIDVTKAERYKSVGTINGWVNMPATFTPGKKIGTEFQL